MTASTIPPPSVWACGTPCGNRPSTVRPNHRRSTASWPPPQSLHLLLRRLCLFRLPVILAGTIRAAVGQGDVSKVFLEMQMPPRERKAVQEKIMSLQTILMGQSRVDEKGLPINLDDVLNKEQLRAAAQDAAKSRFAKELASAALVSDLGAGIRSAPITDAPPPPGRPRSPCTCSCVGCVSFGIPNQSPDRGKTTGIEPHPAHVFPTAERL